MPGVEINNKTRGSDSFDRGIEDDDLAFLPPTEDDLRRFTVSGSNPRVGDALFVYHKCMLHMVSREIC